MKLSDLNNLDINNIGVWPLPLRIFAILLLCGGLLGAGYWFDTQHQIAEWDAAKKKETQLRETFRVKWHKVANLENFRKQLEEMNRSFGAMLRQLPDKTEVADLLVDVSQTGLSNGLEFQLFKPGGEIRKGFYAELPIQLNVTGSYHQFGAFVSELAALPRIVTIHNVDISPSGGTSGSGATPLRMSAIAKTYRYLEETEK